MQVQRVSPAKVHPDDSEGPEHCEAERHLVLIQLPRNPIRNHPVFTCLFYMAGTLQPSNETKSLVTLDRRRFHFDEPST